MAEKDLFFGFNREKEREREKLIKCGLAWASR